MAIREIMERQTVIGDPGEFAIGYAFIGDVEDRLTELSMFAGGSNLLGFTREGCHCTTRWYYLEELVAWLKNFACNMRENSFPANAEGEFLNERYRAAMDAGPEDDDAFYEYSIPITDWMDEGTGHTWLHANGGGILADIFFELKDGMVELSWDNRDRTDGVAFDHGFGGVRVAPEVFKSVVLEFAEAYERHWGIKVDDDGTWLRAKSPLPDPAFYRTNPLS